MSVMQKVSLTASCLLVFLFLPLCLYAAEPGQAPINPLFQIDAEAGPMSALAESGGFATGHRPGPVTPEQHDVSALPKKLSAGVSDAKYDLRDPNLDGATSDSLLSPVKNQGSCGSCWAFATYGSLESHLIKTEDALYDFSEDNLKHLHGGDWGPCDGGNEFLSSAYLGRFCGPISEADDPYDPSESSDFCTSCPPVRYADNHIFLPARANALDLTFLKQALLDYGAIDTSMYWSDNAYNSGTYTYYYSGNKASNHAVTLVGWDDNKVVSGAPGNGAFIIKNTWGEDWGEAGYFYISYYDTKAAYERNVVFTDIDDANSIPFNKIYYYDPLGWVNDFGYGDGDDWAANIFTPSTDGVLNGAGFYLTSSNTAYEIYIYDDFNGSSFSNLLSFESGSRPYAGWYTIPLTTPVRITAGDAFAIVVRFNNGGSHGFPLAMEYALSGYSSAADANPGQSYYSNSGTTFYDLTGYRATANFCIKGFVAETIPAPISYPNLIDWNGNLVADFGDNGMWYHNGTSWNWMTNRGHVNQMVVWDGKLVVDFGPDYGLHYYDGTGWTWMSNKGDVAKMIAWHNGATEKLVVDFGGGRRVYTYNGAWNWLTNKDDVNDMAVWNNKLVVDFGAGRGVYNNNGTWNWMSNKDDIARMVAWNNGSAERLVVDFGGGRRVYTYNGAWSWLTNKDDVNDMAVWNNKLVVDFGSGRCLYNYDTSWHWMSNKDDVAKMVVWNDGTDKLAVDFGGGRGIYYYDGSWHWMKNADDVPEMIAWGTRLAVDFGSGTGIYNYNGAWHLMRTWSTAE